MACLACALSAHSQVSAWAEEGSGQGGSGASAAASAEAAAAGEAATAGEAERPDYSKMSLEELKRLVEEKTAHRDALQTRKTDLEARLEVVQQRLDVVEAKLPGAQSRAEQATIDRYKKQRHSAGLIEAVLAASDFQSFITELKYVESTCKVSLSELRDLRNEEAALKFKKTMLEVEHSAVAAHLEEANADLAAATAARDEAQRKADLVANAHLVPDGADWGAGEEAFIAAWAPRIDAYLAGSPLEGQGKTFAKAAWDHHVDPRWSPAISNTESSKGRVCIRPHNAWGWGAADSNPYGLASEWGSWEEAINAHVAGLARGYGYTISPGGAQMYCPPNWEEWYANTIAQMNSI